MTVATFDAPIVFDDPVVIFDALLIDDTGLPPVAVLAPRPGASAAERFDARVPSSFGATASDRYDAVPLH